MWRRSFVAFIATAFLFACGDSAEESADEAALPTVADDHPVRIDRTGVR